MNGTGDVRHELDEMRASIEGVRPATMGRRSSKNKSSWYKTGHGRLFHLLIVQSGSQVLEHNHQYQVNENELSSHG